MEVGAIHNFLMQIKQLPSKLSCWANSKDDTGVCLFFFKFLIIAGNKSQIYVQIRPCPHPTL